jgi:hypothetical protein
MQSPIWQLPGTAPTGACHGHGHVFRPALHLSQPEIQQLDAVICEQNVAWFQIAVDDAFLMRGVARRKSARRRSKLHRTETGL